MITLHDIFVILRRFFTFESVLDKKFRTPISKVDTELYNSAITFSVPLFFQKIYGPFE